MKKVQEGDFSVSDVVVDSRNEIGSLTKSFDVMTHQYSGTDGAECP